MTKKIVIKSLYKIFGKDPKKAMEYVDSGVGKDELLEKHNHVLGLSNIDLQVSDKSIQVVMGLSGSGKSTLIRHINRLIEPTSGSVMVESQEITKLNTVDLRYYSFEFFQISIIGWNCMIRKISFFRDID